MRPRYLVQAAILFMFISGCTQTQSPNTGSGSSFWPGVVHFLQGTIKAANDAWDETGGPFARPGVNSSGQAYDAGYSDGYANGSISGR